jgi:hypothetical protein
MEEFRDVPGYEGLYQVSNLGNVKSLARETSNGKGFFISKEIIRKPTNDNKGYLHLLLSKDAKLKSFKVHKLVAMAFLNHTPCGMKLVIDHINDNKLDNRVENLQIVTSRFNTYKTKVKYSSKYKGVSWHKKANKWSASIHINGKGFHLGLFTCELAASLAYQNKLKTL